MSVSDLRNCIVTIVTGEPAPPKLEPGLTLIRSPKGSGKTRSLAYLTAWDCQYFRVRAAG